MRSKSGEAPHESALARPRERRERPDLLEAGRARVADAARVAGAERVRVRGDDDGDDSE